MTKTSSGLKSLVGRYVHVTIRDPCTDRGHRFPDTVAGVVRDVSGRMLQIELDQDVNPGDFESVWINVACPFVMAVDVVAERAR